MTCACVNVPMGSYANQERTVFPFDSRPLGIDRCVLEEIKALWARGIRTTGHCCGHNTSFPYIGVEFADIPRMKALGYEVAPNRLRIDDEDSFYPKSVHYPRWRRVWRCACVGLMRGAFRAEGWVA